MFDLRLCVMSTSVANASVNIYTSVLASLCSYHQTTSWWQRLHATVLSFLAAVFHELGGELGKTAATETERILTELELTDI